MATLSRLMAEADPTHGWDRAYRVAMAVIVAVLIAAWSVLMVPPAHAADAPFTARAAAYLDSADIAGLPETASTGDIYYSPWKSHYVNRYGTREYYASRQRADLRSTWQTRSTWPGAFLVQQSRFALKFVGPGLWDLAATWVKNTGMFSLWGVQCDATYRFSGSQVFTDGSNSCRAWGVGFGVDVTPVTWNEGGAFWGGMQVGANYRVSVLTQGVPLFADHWMRVGILTNGTTTAPQGG